MKQRLLFFLMLAITTLAASARDFTYEGIIYTVLDEEAKTVETKAGESYSPPVNEVKGDLTLPAHPMDGDVEYTLIGLGEYAFAQNEKLNSIVLPETIASIGDRAFMYCEALTQCNLPSSLKAIGFQSFYDCRLLRSLDLPNGLTSIGESAFWTCTSLTSVEWPASISTIPYQAFCDCHSLTTVVLPESVTVIDTSAFEDCHSLKNINIPQSLVFIGNSAFEDCFLITSVELPETLTTLEDHAFAYCESLETIKLPNSITTLEYDTFLACKSLTSIEIPESIAEIDWRVFPDCDNLNTVIFKGVPKKIGSIAFPKVANVSICDPDKWCGVNINAAYDDDYVFQPFDNTGSLLVNGSKVRNLVLNPEDGNIGTYAFNSVPVNKVRIKADGTIGEGAFNSSSIEALCLEAKTINDMAFANCEKLKEVYSLTPEPPAAPDNTISNYTGLTLYVPIGSKDKYEGVTCWANFDNIIESDFAGIDEMFRADYSVDDPSSIALISVDTEIDYTLPYQVFNLNGTFVGNGLENLEKGIYIIRQGEKAKKIAH